MPADAAPLSDRKCMSATTDLKNVVNNFQAAACIKGVYTLRTDSINRDQSLDCLCYFQSAHVRTDIVVYFEYEMNNK